MSGPARTVATLVALSVLLSAAGAPMPGIAQEIGCSGPTDRDAQLQEAQKEVLELLGDLATLDGETDLLALAALGYDFYDHQQVSFEDMGWAVIDLVGPQHAGRPFVLLYAPTPPPPPGTVTEPRDGFDFPYELAGWAYSPPARYDFRSHPMIKGLECIEREEWFVHERGVHPFEDGGMRSVPPREEIDGLTPHGTSFGADVKPLLPETGPGDFPHPRIWDLHVWLSEGEDDVPTVSLLNPGDPIPGIEPGVGVSPPGPNDPFPAFYYPPRVADLAVGLDTDAGSAWPGQELRRTVTVLNRGPDRATGTTLTVELSRQTPATATPSQGTCTSTKLLITCELGDLPRDPAATVELVLRATGREPLTITYSATANEEDLTCTVDAGIEVDPDDDALLCEERPEDARETETT